MFDLAIDTKKDDKTTVTKPSNCGIWKEKKSKPWKGIAILSRALPLVPMASLSLLAVLTTPSYCGT